MKIKIYKTARGYVQDTPLKWVDYIEGVSDFPFGLARPYYKGKPFTGTIEWFDEEGIIELRERLKGGCEHGPQETYYKDQLSEIRNFKNGELHGVCEYFDKDGNLDMKMIYKNDELIKTQSWEEGNLIYTWEN